MDPDPPTIAIKTVLICMLFLSACGVSIPQEGSAQSPDMAAKLLPPPNKTLLFIGQDSDTISDYIDAVPEDNIEGITLYTGIKHADPAQTLRALFSGDNWQSGDVDFGKTLSSVPDAALAVGLAFDGCGLPAAENHEANIADGSYDRSVNFMLKHFKSLAPRKVFLRIGYEFDGPWNCYSPANYKTAFRKIAKAIKDQGASNIATVWQSASWPDGYGNANYDIGAANHLNHWYPGDDAVDWIGMSVFYRDLSQWNYRPPRTPQQAQQLVLDFARGHGKPVMIAESAPQGFRTGQLTRSVIQQNDPHPVSAGQIWQAWYRPYFDFIKANKDIIRAVAYINTHWETQPMWQCRPGIAAGQPGCNGGNWGDSRVQANGYIKAKWLEQVNDASQWIQTGRY